MDKNIDTNNWSQWSIYVIKSLERLSLESEATSRKIDDLKEMYLIPLKIKVTIISVIAGAFGGIMMSLIVPILIKLLFDAD